MSRSTVSKSRADKSKDKDKDRGGSTSVPAPPASTDVIPGRFTEEDWNNVLDKEDGEEFIVDIVSEIVGSAIDVIYDNYIQKQLYPYVVDKSRSLFLHIIEWQFLARDEGESDPVEDDTWAEEEEPLPGNPDAWAQGSVPHQCLPPVSPIMSEHDTEITSVSRISNPEILDDLPSTVNETATVDEAETEHGEDAERPMYGGIHRREEDGTATEDDREQRETEERIDEKDKETNNNEKIVEVKMQPRKPRRPKYKPYRGPLKSAGVRFIHRSLEETEQELIEAEMKLRGPERSGVISELDYMPSSCHNILKVQAGRPPGGKDVTYDDLGNVIAVLRIDPERLPSHRVRTKYTVIDPAVEAAQARLQAMRTGRHFKMESSMKQTHQQITQQGTRSGNRLISRVNGSHVGAAHSTLRKTAIDEEEEGITPLPPPLIESMELAPGVIIREGGRVKQGPKLALRNADVSCARIRPLRPLVATDANGVPLTIEDFIGSRSPSVKPLTVNDPIPPILPRHTPSRENIVIS